jgi:predicted transcriptional regulator
VQLQLDGVRMADKRKGSVQIRFEILEFLFFADKPQLRTHLWRKATDVSYDDFLKHLIYLREKGFVNETSEGQILLTAEGRKIYINLRDSLPSLL